jgi:hypothetical protein
VPIINWLQVYNITPLVILKFVIELLVTTDDRFDRNILSNLQIINIYVHMNIDLYKTHLIFRNKNFYKIMTFFLKFFIIGWMWEMNAWHRFKIYLFIFDILIKNILYYFTLKYFFYHSTCTVRFSERKEYSQITFNVLDLCLTPTSFKLLLKYS